MGHNSYNSTEASLRSTSKNYANATMDSLFEQIKHRAKHSTMSPDSGKVKECRDSDAHPTSFPVILALDVTGSMRGIPQHFLASLLTKLISEIQTAGFDHTAILIMAIGDHYRDSDPFQVSEFESGDEQLDMWLKRIYPEGGGGGNGGESYHLAYKYADKFTISDHFEKRNQKGLLITIGDEPCHSTLEKNHQKSIFGPGEYKDETVNSLLEAASKKYDVYHLHIMQGQEGKNSIGFWKELLGENCIPVNNYEETSKHIAKLVISSTKFIGIPKPDFFYTEDLKPNGPGDVIEKEDNTLLQDILKL